MYLLLGGVVLFVKLLVTLLHNLLNHAANVAHKPELNLGLLDITTLPGKALFELGNLFKA